jgi:integrase/recombinase XerD
MFCTRELPGRSPSVAANLAAGLRSFLRFLHVEGVVGAPLGQAVPPVAHRKGTGLPRGLPRGAVARLLASCDRRTRLGRRDFAILLLLARLGLRAGEIAGLSLDDIDWRAGEIVVHGKGARDDRLPLPDDVGTAIVGYLKRGRPKTDSRTVFLRAIAPTVALTPQGITWVVYSACDRAGLAKMGAHRLRHTLASDLLRSGGTLVEVGQILRHARVGTTAIYAKVDFAALAPLAQPWPGGAA